MVVGVYGVGVYGVPAVVGLYFVGCFLLSSIIIFKLRTALDCPLAAS